MTVLPPTLIEELHSVCDFNPESEAEVVQAFVACGWLK